MKRKKLTGDIAIVFGTFAPMHIGHVDLIQQAARNHDGVLVLVSGRETAPDRGAEIGLPLTKRARYAREVFKDDELVVVEKLDETGIPIYPYGWQPWSALLQDLVRANTKDLTKLTFYVGEAEYVGKLKDHIEPERFGLSNIAIELMDRSMIPISATAIRKEPHKNWAYMTHPFRRHFTRKVLVVGSASGGKSTLVKHLANFFNCPYSPEYARLYQVQYNVRDEELAYGDYINLLSGQFNQTRDLIDAGNHMGLVIADTNSTVTKAYIDHYLKGEVTEDQYQALTKTYELVRAQEDWDLIFLVEPKTTYVDDGFRDMTMADEQTRDQFTAHLRELLRQEGVPENKIVTLSAPDGVNPFAHNYETAKAVIQERLAIHRL